VKHLAWDKVFRHEVEEIDEGHRKLLNIFNILNDSLSEGAPPDYLAAVLKELINCTAWHFSHEERLMLKYGYEEIEEHTEAHRKLMNSVEKLQQEITQADKPVSYEVIEFLEDWLTEHILTDDMRMDTYLSQKM
jgi:hemerythrin